MSGFVPTVTRRHDFCHQPHICHLDPLSLRHVGLDSPYEIHPRLLCGPWKIYPGQIDTKLLHQVIGIFPPVFLLLPMKLIRLGTYQ